MKRYTEKIHAGRLRCILEMSKTCYYCPAAKWENNKEGVAIWSSHRSETCKICKNFVGLASGYKCPCQQLGTAEAIKRSWLVLERKGYI